ncbi:MAG: 4-hydroxy-tetrahydrodipicolinate synthase [Acidimicrobiaceae bacterium]|nr:4-hydroxy-tetrahydrodipicolinate synthase [Acidimicrobiaceae bacterium]
MMPLAPGHLRGSYPPLVTPFRDGEVDYDGYAALVEHQVVAGSHGIVVNGTTATPSTLTIEERAELVRVAVKTASGRLPVVAATGSQSHAETVWLTEQADAAGADALLIVTPYYVKPSQRGLVEYFADLGRRSDLPLLVYNIPGRTAVAVTPATLEEIAERTPTFVGLKHAVNDLGFVTDVLLRLGPELRIFVGLEELSFPMLCLGASGLMNAVGNLAPDRVAELFAAVDRGDLHAGRAMHDQLFELNTSVFFDTNPVPIKWMMVRMGLLGSDEHRLPMVAADEALQARLEPVLRRAGLIGA